MAKHCEALGTGTRKKLSNWLAHEYGRTRTPDKLQPAFHSNGHPVAWKGPVKPIDPSSAIRLPPASPYDNFLKAAGC
uniref:Uncharacterized protein n=1 Tax=Rhizophora mucronata TaxID=61149 RepID=A0A2P2PNZ0_RHIMU